MWLMFARCGAEFSGLSTRFRGGRRREDSAPLAGAFIEARSDAARSTPSSVPSAKTAPQAKQDGGQRVAPANTPAPNHPTTTEVAQNVSSTVTTIKELRAQIERSYGWGGCRR
jgi:hypothetical protein